MGLELTPSHERKARGKALQPTILGMATGNPPYACSQEQALAVAQKVPGIDSVQPVLGRIYGNSRIHNRYMSVPDFTPDQQLEGDEMFFNPDMKFQMPVETRLDKFREKAVDVMDTLIRDRFARADRDALCATGARRLRHGNEYGDGYWLNPAKPPATSSGTATRSRMKRATKARAGLTTCTQRWIPACTAGATTATHGRRSTVAILEAVCTARPAASARWAYAGDAPAT